MTTQKSRQDETRNLVHADGVPEQSGIERRQFLKLGVSTGAGILLHGSFTGCEDLDPLPIVLLDETLEVNMAEIDVNPGEQFRTYNGKVPGPTLRVRRGLHGGQLRVRLVNALPPNPADDPGNCPPDLNVYHGQNTTNLHTHGLHVSPDKDSTGTYDADNIFLKVLPDGDPQTCGGPDFRQREVQYVYDIRSDHPPGTHWYHAHKHGSAARQVANGLAGALIIEEEDWDNVPPYIAHIPRDREHVLMIQNISNTEHGFTGPLSIIKVNEDGGGDRNPTIVMRPGEVQRWRIINAATAPNTFVSLLSDAADLEVYQISYDGLTLPRRLPVDLNDNREPWENPAALAPANRTDFLVRAPVTAAGQQYRIRSSEFDRGTVMGERIFLAEQVLLTVNVEGDPVESEWSDDDTLPGPGLPPLTPVAAARDIRFQIVDGKLGIDGELFTGNVRDDRKMNLGATEEWTVWNDSDFTHPFHIHVNPFLVTHVNGEELSADDPRRRWQDTVGIPPQQGDQPGSITFRSHFIDFTGKFVIHCHILGHEDTGMMQAVEVVEAQITA